MAPTSFPVLSLPMGGLALCDGLPLPAQLMEATESHSRLVGVSTAFSRTRGELLAAGTPGGTDPAEGGAIDDPGASRRQAVPGIGRLRDGPLRQRPQGQAVETPQAPGSAQAQGQAHAVLAPGSCPDCKAEWWVCSWASAFLSPAPLYRVFPDPSNPGLRTFFRVNCSAPLVEAGDHRSPRPGVGGQYSPALWRVRTRHLPQSSGIDQVGVGMAQEDVQVAVQDCHCVRACSVRTRGFLQSPVSARASACSRRVLSAPVEAHQIEVVTDIAPNRTASSRAAITAASRAPSLLAR